MTRFEMKFRAVQMLSLALLIGVFSTEQYTNHKSLMNAHPFVFAHLFFMVWFGLSVWKAKPLMLWNAEQWTEETILTLKKYALLFTFTLLNFGLWLNEMRWLEHSFGFKRSYCVFPVCIEGRSLVVYVILAASTMFLLRAIKRKELLL